MGRPADARVEVDATGWFETAALRAGEWQVAWAPEGGVPQARRLSVSLAEADEQDVMLRFPLLARRRLAVSAGEPLALGGLPAGRYLVTVGSTQAPFSVEEGRSRELRLP